MKLPSLNIGHTLSHTAETVKANWSNQSTVAKIATVSGTILMTGAAVAAAILGSAGLAALAGLTGIAVIASLHGIVPAVASACSAIALAIPTLSLLKKPEAPKAVEVELTAAPVETAVGPEVEEVTVEAPKAAPSRLERLRSAACKHKGKIAAGVITLGTFGAGVAFINGTTLDQKMVVVSRVADAIDTILSVGTPATRINDLFV